jgi:membrane-bound metal-dependent hydrolase YbcI (DUF457 family)
VPSSSVHGGALAFNLAEDPCEYLQAVPTVISTNAVFMMKEFSKMSLDFVSYPWSHSLLMCALWAVLFATIYYWMTRYWPATIAIAIGVLSHWLLDWITHGADMPLYPGGPKFGLGLWNSVAGTLSVELAMFAIGVWLYVSVTRSRDRIGRYAFLAYFALLVAGYLRNTFSSELPHSVKAEIAWPGLIAGIVMLIWAWWFDRHREPNAKNVPA